VAALVLSDPVSIGGRQVADLSRPAGSVPQASSAMVTNRRTGSTVVLAVDDGGWKAAELEASEGDSIIVRMDQPMLVMARAVPEVSAPVVVRVEPPRGKRDVPLNARVYIAFSEPIDAATVSATSVYLTRDGSPVPGQVNVTEGGLAATIDPEQDLAPSTDYEVTISAAVKDLDGDPAVPLSSAFSTGTMTAEEVPDLQLDPSAADFGLAWVGGLGNRRDFRVWNVGLGTGTVIASIAGAAAADFRITLDECGFRELAPYEQCTIQVTFVPAATGVRNAVLLIGDASAALSGTADADRLTLFPDALDFGPVMAGRATIPTEFVVTNVGTEPSSLLRTVLLGDCSPLQIANDACALPFRIVEDRCNGQSLVPGQACSVALEFRPERVGLFAGRLALTSRATATARLDGEALGLVPGLGSESHQPLTIPWGLMGSLVVSNTGPERSGPISEPDLSGPFTIVTNSCSGNVVEPGSSCTIILRFASSLGHAASGLLRLAASPGGSVTAYLHGQAR
jgi:hypothetical protein